MRLTIHSTDTGTSLRFVIIETGQGANYDTGWLLSQNRLGLTLFALPRGRHKHCVRLCQL
ncbi:MAG: hypothetical protein D6706_18335 [Chloroflexi bacterium]|nr:MAG: hypothetical protein D6706_18335 [Chloroflexota bacterium]